MQNKSSNITSMNASMNTSMNTSMNIENLIKIENPDNKLYTAVIVEPREHKALELVLKNFTDNLDKNIWLFVIYCSEKNKNYVLNIKNKLNIDIVIIPLFNNNITISQYSKLLVTKEFYEVIPTNHLLIFQTDSIILNKDIIYDFMKYDYVGAPWPDKNNGNGGLSLRKRTKMIDIINKKVYNNEAEDLYFCINTDCYKPDFENAKRFSVESVYCDNPFGIHKCWVCQSNNYKKIIEKYPIVEELRLLQ